MAAPTTIEGGGEERKEKRAKGKRERERDSESGCGAKRAKADGWKTNKSFSILKTFYSFAFTVFFVAAVNEARFLITLGCSMILL